MSAKAHEATKHVRHAEHSFQETIAVILDQNRHLLDRFEARLRSGWEMYRGGVQRHQQTIDMIEDGLDRIMYLSTFHSSDIDDDNNSATWREILYGLLSLNRLAMDCAARGRLDRSFGTTLSTAQSPLHVPVRTIRIALNVTHCIMPSLLGIVPSLDQMSKRRNEARVRLLLERIKCYLRLWLLVTYWCQSLREQQASRSNPCRVDPRIGLLRRGGMYQNDEVEGMSPKQQDALEVRRLYNGVRTGRRVSPTSDFAPALSTRTHYFGRVVCAEILHALRPLYWASAEASIFPSDNRTIRIHTLAHLKPWLLTLLMDLASLRLSSHLRSNGNPLTRQEWNRRRMKLFLYLLRSPLWGSFTSPAADRVFDVVKRVPILGNLIETYMKEWLLYWRHPFSSEES